MNLPVNSSAIAENRLQFSSVCSFHFSNENDGNNFNLLLTCLKKHTNVKNFTVYAAISHVDFKHTFVYIFQSATRRFLTMECSFSAVLR